MTINRISGSSHGGIKSLYIDYVENVDDISVMSETAIELPIQEGSVLYSEGTKDSAAGPIYELKIQGFISGIDETNLAELELFNNRKIIAWFEDLHTRQYAMGKLTEPARITLDITVPSNHKNPAGFNFTITSRQTTGMTVL